MGRLEVKDPVASGDSALVAAAIGLGSKWGIGCQAKPPDNAAAHRFKCVHPVAHILMESDGT